MIFLRNLKDNWRELIGLLVVGLGFSLLADFAVRVSILYLGLGGLSNFVSLLQGFSKFVGAHCCACIIGIGAGWPTLARFGIFRKGSHQAPIAPDDAENAKRIADRESFASGWVAIGPHGRFYVFVGVTVAEIIAAALCFA